MDLNKSVCDGGLIETMNKAFHLRYLKVCRKKHTDLHTAVTMYNIVSGIDYKV